jgi:hypothetical protein
VKVFPEAKRSYALRLRVHLDIVGFILQIRQNCFDKNSLVTVPRPPDSPDLAPSNFSLFGHIKTSFACYVLNDVDQLFEAVLEFLNEIQPSELELVFTAGSNE